MLLKLVALAVLAVRPLAATEIISDIPRAPCQEIHLSKDLRVYRDPALYASNLGLLDIDPVTGLEGQQSDSPLLTTMKGTIHIMQLAPPQDMRDFGAIAKLYELPEAKVKRIGKGNGGAKGARAELNPSPLRNLAIPIRFCGENDAYSDTLGFVFVNDLQDAQVDDRDTGQLPPSVQPNPIPKPKLSDLPPVDTASPPLTPRS